MIPSGSSNGAVNGVLNTVHARTKVNTMVFFPTQRGQWRLL